MKPFLVLFVSLCLVSAANAAEKFAPSAANGTKPGAPALAANASTREVAGPGAPAAIGLSGYLADDKYRLRPGDKLSFQILEDRMFDDKDVPKPLMVADSGELDVPYIGRVMAMNKTCKQLAEEIKSTLEKDYYHSASVVLALDVANKYLGRVYVWGQVRNQGAIDVAINEKITAGKAILRAGGFSDFANKKKVKVIRGSEDSSEKKSFELNMIEILEQGKTENDIQLQPDDYVLVPSRLINF